ncbi:MAG: FecR domain-containing protein [Desulfococcaceae bacterium]
MKGITYIFLAFFLLLPSAGTCASSVGAVTAFQGQAEIIRPGQPGIPTASGMPVHAGDMAKTGKRSKLEIRFDDGSIIRLGENSHAEIAEYLFEDDSVLAKIFLHAGKVRSIVKKAKGLFGMDEINRFEVHTDTAVIGARGTDFVTFRKGKISRALFIRGEGYCYPVGNPEALKKVAAGQSVTVNRADAVPFVQKGNESEIRENLNDTTIWKDSGFIWNNPGPDDTVTASPY